MFAGKTIQSSLSSKGNRRKKLNKVKEGKVTRAMWRLVGNNQSRILPLTEKTLVLLLEKHPEGVIPPEDVIQHANMLLKSQPEKNKVADLNNKRPWV